MSGRIAFCIGAVLLNGRSPCGELESQALEQTPPDLGTDVAEGGVMLTGGGALPRNMDKLIMTHDRATGTDCRRSDNLCCS